MAVQFNILHNRKSVLILRYISSYFPDLDLRRLLTTKINALSSLTAFPIFSTDFIDKSELKAFFESNCSQIYFIFYENFITLESNLKQKGKYY